MATKMTSKKRAKLRAEANNLKATVLIGKDGVSKPLVAQAELELKAREMIKCHVLETSPLDVKEACAQLSAATQSESVQIIGRVFVLYRENDDSNKKKRKKDDKDIERKAASVIVKRPPRRILKLGIFGGTFNPPHLGHQTATAAAFEALKLDKLLIVPNSIPPHKRLPKDTATPEQRVRMVQYMADNLQLPKRVTVSDVEMKRTGRSYTADTVQAVRSEHPYDTLWLLMGTDMFMSFHRWVRPEVITENAGLCVFSRSRLDDREEILSQKTYLEENFGARVRLIEVPNLVECSSTQVRNGLPKGEKTELLAENIYGYILRNGLYGTHADMKHLDIPELRAVCYSMIKAKRIPHVKGVEQEAAKLAERWGADPVKARRAGILHDCTKYLTLPEQLEICEDNGILLDALEQKTVKLLHAKTGAFVAKDYFGECEEVCDAIYWHTTGKANMTLLEKIIYMADYMEPTRDFEGVEKLRDLAYKDLDAAMQLGFEMTVEEMRTYGEPVHPRTLEALEYLKN